MAGTREGALKAWKKMRTKEWKQICYEETKWMRFLINILNQISKNL